MVCTTDTASLNKYLIRLLFQSECKGQFS